MADFPVVLTTAVDGSTDVMAKHLNNLEAKVGIDGSAVTTTLDYLLKVASDPGHSHTAYSLTSHNHAGVYDVAGAAAAITPATLGLVIGTNVLAYRTFGTAAAADTTAFDAAGAAAAITPTTLGLVIGTNVLAYRTFGTAAAANTTAFDAAGAAAAITPTTLGLVIGTNVLAYRTFGTAANSASGDFATAAQGTLATNALPKGGGTMTGKIVKAGTSEVGKTYTPGSGAQTVAIDCSVNNVHVVTGNSAGTAITFTITGATDSQPFIISILQGTSPSTIAGWFATIRWAGGSAPVLTPTAGKRDTFGIIRTGTNTYDGFIIGQNA